MLLVVYFVVLAVPFSRHFALAAPTPGMLLISAAGAALALLALLAGGRTLRARR